MSAFGHSDAGTRLDDLRALAHQPSTQIEYVVHKAVACK
jgi:hypothetical protein